MSNESAPQVDFEDYTKLKYQLTYELKTLTENVNRLAEVTEKKLCEHDGRIDKLEKTPETRPKKATLEEQKSSLSPSIKWLLVVILGVAFLGTLGAAIGINLLGYLSKLPLK